METEKSLEKSRAEKEAMDKSGYSELQTDLNVNRQRGDLQNTQRVQQGKKIFTSTKKIVKEEVILENTAK
jgi:hypothetical protein